MTDTTKLYYLPPADFLFEEMRSTAIRIWRDLADPYDTPDRVRDLQAMTNIGDNFMTILAQFDDGNQRLLMEYSTKALQQAVRDRIISVNGYCEL